MRPSGAIYRLARRPDPWAAPNWAWAHFDGTFGNRFDDPLATYRVLYASSQRLGCFLETLARFRLDLALLAEFAQIEGENDQFPQGEVPIEWLQDRVLGEAEALGEYADICRSTWLSRLRIVLAAQLKTIGMSDLDASTLQRSVPRTLTQSVSRIAFGDGLAGIRYLSRHGHDIENWALFEPFQIAASDVQNVLSEDADLQQALALHRLKLRG